MQKKLVYLEGGKILAVNDDDTQIEMGTRDPQEDRPNRILKLKPIIYRITDRTRADGTRIFEYDANSAEQIFHDFT